MSFSIVRPRPKTAYRARLLRRRTTLAERILWKKLRGRKFHEIKFRRQVPIGPFIADFACVESRLVVEVDGYVHQFKIASDRRQEEYLRAQGFTVLRIKNGQIYESLDWVLEQILAAAGPHPSLLLCEGEGTQF